MRWTKVATRHFEAKTPEGRTLMITFDKWESSRPWKLSAEGMGTLGTYPTLNAAQQSFASALSDTEG